jgi:hypothetical protein
LIYYSLSGPQPVAGGTCIPLMQYYLQNVVKSWCTALKSPLLSCIIDPLHENTSLFSAWYTTDSEDVSVLCVSCQLQYHLQPHKGKVGKHPLFISLFRCTCKSASGHLVCSQIFSKRSKWWTCACWFLWSIGCWCKVASGVEGCQSTHQVLELVNGLDWPSKNILQNKVASVSREC